MRSVIDSARIASQSPNLEGWASSRNIAVRWNHDFSFVSHSKRAGEHPLDVAWWTAFDHVHHSTHKVLARLPEAPGEAWTAIVIGIVKKSAMKDQVFYTTGTALRPANPAPTTDSFLANCRAQICRFHSSNPEGKSENGSQRFISIFTFDFYFPDLTAVQTCKLQTLLKPSNTAILIAPETK